MLGKWIILFLIGSFPFGQDAIGEGLYENELIEFLQQNFTTSTVLSYGEARDILYSEIDSDDGIVYGIYTNYSVALDPDADPSVHLYENGMNCEHVWPQSQYAGDYPMKSDIHILRPAKENVNSSRSNKPFGESENNQTQHWFWLDVNLIWPPSSNIDEYSESASGLFEPREDVKGDIARTVFYFYTIYQSVADQSFFAVQKYVLKTWHEQDPINEDEITRTWQIAGYQEDKPNPFILDETLVERAYFYDGALQGDMNGDGELNILDAVALMNMILSGGETNPAGDMNGDGAYNILDVVILANIILSQN